MLEREMELPNLRSHSHTTPETVTKVTAKARTLTSPEYESGGAQRADVNQHTGATHNMSAVLAISGARTE